MIAALIWAVQGVSYKFFLLSGFTFLGILLITRFFRLVSVLLIAYKKNVRHVSIDNFSELKFLFLNSIFSVGTPLFFILGLEFTKTSNIYFLEYTMPAWVFLLAAVFLGEKINSKKILGLILTLLGIFFISNPEHLLTLNMGIVFGFLAAISFAGDIITSRELKDYSYHTVAIYTLIFQLIIYFLMAFFILPEAVNFSSITLIGILPLIALGLVLGIASDLYYFALENIDASTAGIFLMSELVFVSVLAFVFLKEMPSLTELFGYCLIMVSGAILILRKSDLENFEYLLHLRKKR